MAKSVKLRHRRRSHVKTHKRAPKREAKRAVRETRRVQRKAHHKRRSNEAKKTRKAAARPKATARPKAVAKRRKTVGRRRRTRGGSGRHHLSPAALKNDVQIGKEGSTIVVTSKSERDVERGFEKGVEGVGGYYTAGSLAYGTYKAAPAVSKAVARAIRIARGPKPEALDGPQMVSNANNDTMSFEDKLNVQSSMDSAPIDPALRARMDALRGRRPLDAYPSEGAAADTTQLKSAFGEGDEARSAAGSALEQSTSPRQSYASTNDKGYVEPSLGQRIRNVFGRKSGSLVDKVKMENEAVDQAEVNATRVTRGDLSTEDNLDDGGFES
jgi:hypothetical protein